MAIEKLVSKPVGQTGTMTGKQIEVAVNATIDAVEAISGGAYMFIGNSLDDDTVDNTPLLITAVNNAVSGTTIEFIGGGVYHFLTPCEIEVGEKVIVFKRNGATCVYHDVSAPGLQVKSNWSFNEPFGTLNDITLDGIADTTGLRAREMIRLFSNDLALDTRGAIAYQAEDIYLENIIDANSLLLGNVSTSISGPNVPYITSPRIAQRAGGTAHFIGGIDKHPEGLTGLSHTTAAIVRLVGLTNPTMVNCSTTRGYRWGLETVACLGATIINPKFANGEDPAKVGDMSVFGSGLIDCSTGTRVFNINGNRIRHLIDTHCQTYGNQPNNPEMYGSSTDMTVFGGQATNTTGDSYGGHHQCRNLNYIACHSTYSEAFGFQIRGDVTLRDCTDSYCNDSINIFDEDDLEFSRTKGLVHDHVSDHSGAIVNSNRNSAVHFYNYTARNAKVTTSGGFYKSGHEEATIQFHGHTNIQYAEPPNAFSTYFGANVKGTILFNFMCWEFQNFTTKSYRGIDVRGNGAATNNFKMKGDVLCVKGTGVDMFLRGAVANPVDNGQLRFNLIFDDGVGTWGATPQGNDTNIQICQNGDYSFIRTVNVKQSSQMQKFGVSFSALLSTAEIAAGQTEDVVITVDGLVENLNRSITASINDIDIEICGIAVLSESSVTLRVRNTSATAKTLTSAPISIAYDNRLITD